MGSVGSRSGAEEKHEEFMKQMHVPTSGSGWTGQGVSYGVQRWLFDD